jgi:hypothetical protein
MATVNLETTILEDQVQAEQTLSLSPEDDRWRQIFERRLDFIRDRTKSVSEGYQNGVYLVGRPGTGKTHTVRETLERNDASYLYRNARMTPMGLFEELSANADRTIVLDDISSLFDQRQSLQILMAALGGKLGSARPVTYIAKNSHERKSFSFSGGIIAISNVPLRRDPLADALASRVILHEHEPNDAELAALMRYLALKGKDELNPEECLAVIEFVIDESRQHDYRLDLRLMDKGLQDYLQWKDGNTLRSWQELIRASMKQTLRHTLGEKLTKQEEIQLEVDMVLRLMEKYPDDPRRQIEESGLKPSTFYERRKLLKKVR